MVSIGKLFFSAITRSAARKKAPVARPKPRVAAKAAAPRHKPAAKKPRVAAGRKLLTKILHSWDLAHHDRRPASDRRNTKYMLPVRNPYRKSAKYLQKHKTRRDRERVYLTAAQCANRKREAKPHVCMAVIQSGPNRGYKCGYCTNNGTSRCGRHGGPKSHVARRPHARVAKAPRAFVRIPRARPHKRPAARPAAKAPVRRSARVAARR